MTIKDTETLREKLQNSCDLLIRELDKFKLAQQTCSHMAGEKQPKEGQFGE